MRLGMTRRRIRQSVMFSQLASACPLTQQTMFDQVKAEPEDEKDGSDDEAGTSSLIKWTWQSLT